MKNLTQDKFLNDNELETLVKTLNKNKESRDSILIFMAIFTGARCQEILNLRKKDIKNKVVIVKGIKNSNDRSIPIPDDFYNTLLKYMKNLSNDDCLFPVTTRQVRRIWDSYRPNSDLGFHCLRHTLGVRLYKASKDIHAVKTILGHKSIDNTMIYMNYVESNKELKKELKKLWNVKNAS